jgi:benzoyl-CoA reductase/2-hydroxyglutaryl-CoA dehydratase subunit BcrC/BadD/HgdB
MAVPIAPRKKATNAASKIPGMVKSLISEAHRAKQEGRPTAYSFICSGYDEIIRAMDITPIWVENFAGVCAAKREAPRFLERAEAGNFSRSLCTYATCGLGFDLLREELGQMPPSAPWGGQVRPDVMLGSGQMICDPRYKWFQAAQQLMPDVPVYVTNAFYPPFEDDIDYREIIDHYVRYMTEELRGLVRFLEKNTRRKMDWDRLSELVDLTDRTWTLIHNTYELRKAVPTPMDTGDAMNTMVPVAFMMATQQCYDFFTELYAELQDRIANKIGVIPEEKYRLMWGGGLPSWFALSDFNYFWSKGAVFPVETTYRVIEDMAALDIPRVSDPLEHIAWRYIKYFLRWHDAARKRPGSHPDVERLILYIEDYKIDGIVIHEAFSCRSWHPGLLWQLSVLKKIYKPVPVLTLGRDGKSSQEYREVPSLVLESDIVDISSYSEADTHNRIDAFIATLESQKK